MELAGHVQTSKSLYDVPPPLNGVNQHNKEGNNHQDMNEMTHRKDTRQGQQPQN
jgi:hypothetical protein